jgi:hypothetical protein
VSMRPLAYALAALLGVAAATALVACGGDRSALIPQRSADRLKSELSEVRSAVHAGDCQGAQRAVSRFRGTLGNLPSRVDRRLVARLREGVTNLSTVAERQCREPDTQTTTVPTTETTTPETTPTETTPTDTTPADTTPTDTTPTDTTPTETTPPATTTQPPSATPPAAPGTTGGGAATP